MQGTEHLVRYSLVIIFFFSSLTIAKDYPVKKVDILIKSGVNYLLNQNYPEAKNKFIELDRTFPEIPLGKIYLAVYEILKSLDYCENIDEENVNNILKKARDMSDSLYEINNNDLWTNYFMALSDGYYAVYKGFNGDYFTAITNGISAVSYFEKCIEIDSLFYDSYIALGTYYYWKSAKTKSISWLPFISDDRELGKRLLEKSLDKETYAHFFGAYSLVWVFIERKEYYNAIRVCEDMLEKYPNNRLFKQTLARIYVDVDKYKAIRLYGEVLNSIYLMNRNNHCLEIEIKHKIAMQYNDLGNFNKALTYCDDILNIKNLKPYVKKELGDRLDRVKNLKKEIIQKIKN